jgi:hypothetical protein
MRLLKGAKPSPAMVVACLALLVALTGTSVAAVSQLGRNTVGTPQLKNNAVNSKKVKNGSLLRADFKRGQIPAGARGPAGPAGPAGAQGAQGAQGVQGVQGAQGVPGTARAYAFVEGTTLVAGWNSGFTAVARPQVGVYCLTPAAGINPDAHPPVVAVDWGGSTSGQLGSAMARTRHGGCGAGLYEVRTYASTVVTNNVQDPAPSNSIAFTIIVP